MRKLLCSLAWLCVSTLASHALTYTLTDLGTLGGRSSRAVAINQSGQVAGDSTLTNPPVPPPAPPTLPVQEAFIWTPTGGLQGLGNLGGKGSTAAAINDAGQIVGTASTTDRAFDAGFVWTPGIGMQNVGSLGGETAAVDINNSGQVVGTSGRHAFLWTAAGGIKDLGTLGGSSSDAVAINDAGQVTGSSQTTNGEVHLFLWTAATGMQDLGSVPGTTETHPTAINKLGQITGAATTPQGNTHAFFWSKATGFQDLGTLGGPSSTGFDINDSGQIAGTSLINENITHGFFWTPGSSLRDLGSLDGPSGTSDARALNNSAQVVGSSGTTPHAYVWTAATGLQDLGPGIASDINDAGEIIGIIFLPDGSFHAALWRPGAAVDVSALKALVQAQVTAGNIAANLQNSLNAKLDAAQAALDRGQNKTASNILGAFINQVQAQQGKKITDAAATALISAANSLIASLGG